MNSYDNTATIKQLKHMFSTSILKKRMRLISTYIVLSLLVIGFGSLVITYCFLFINISFIRCIVLSFLVASRVLEFLFAFLSFNITHVITRLTIVLLTSEPSIGVANFFLI